MKIKNTYAERIEEFRGREQAWRDLRALLEYRPWPYLMAVCKEPMTTSERKIRKMLFRDCRGLQRALRDNADKTIGEILTMIIGSDDPDYGEDHFYVNPRYNNFICESVLIDPFELYRERNNCGFDEIRRKYCKTEEPD